MFDIKQMATRFEPESGRDTKTPFYEFERLEVREIAICTPMLML